MIIDIIGAGIGGLTLGVALKKKGFSVRVFDKAKEMKAVGAGIVLANNAMQVYQKLGLSDEISKVGNPISSIDITNQKLKTISKTSLVDFEEEYQLKNRAIHRGKLQQVLMAQFTKEEIYLDHELEDIQEERGCKTLTFKNQKTYTSRIVIGADGIYSKVRALLFDEVEIRNAKQVCWRGVLNYNLSKKEQAVEAWGKGSRFGFVQIDNDKVYWYALQNLKNNSKELPEKIPKDLFSEYDIQVLELINKTTNTNIHTAFIEDIKPFGSWSRKGVCLIGDAAHATTPNMGQGACQAIEDAYVLSACLNKYNDVQKAFVEYEKLRVKKAHQIVKTSFMIGKLSQLSNPILMFLRNTLLKLIPSKMNKNQMRFIFKIAEVS